MSTLDDVGGRDGLERVVRAFVERMASDFVVGFHFEGKDLDRIVHREVELASEHLGGGDRYGGRSLSEVHAPLRIHRGHFRRRLHVLEATLRAHGWPEDLVARWLAHDRSLESVVSSPDDCAPPR
ncbi:MAG: group 1 truncated hemoglobin [Alphaproteobacteria bacterium]|nr:group 1 truncated hemoglobin [Alphaproteobacteria bacterium]